MTTRIRLGAGGVMLPNHSPLKVAESYKLLEAIHPGRIDLGHRPRAGNRWPDGARSPPLAGGPRRGRLPRAARGAHRVGQRDVSGRSSVPRRPRDARRPAAAPASTSSDRGLRREAGRGDGRRVCLCGTFQSGSARASDAGLPIGVFDAAACSTNPTPSSRFRSTAPTPRRRPSAWPRRCRSRLSSFESGRPGRLPSPDEAMAHVFTPEEQGLPRLTRSSRSSARPSRSAPASRTSSRGPRPTR